MCVFFCTCKPLDPTITGYRYKPHPHGGETGRLKCSSLKGLADAKLAMSIGYSPSMIHKWRSCFLSKVGRMDVDGKPGAPSEMRNEQHYSRECGGFYCLLGANICSGNRVSMVASMLISVAITKRVLSLKLSRPVNQDRYHKRRMAYKQLSAVFSKNPNAK